MNARIAFGVLLGIVAGGLLFWTFLIFAFHGYCSDSCDKPPWTLAGAVRAALPWGLGALAVLGAACYELMRSRTARPSAWAALALAVASAAAFVVAIGVVAVATDVFGALVGSPFVAAVWLAGTVLAARRLRPREPRTG